MELMGVTLLIVMNLITIFLCILSNQVTSQTEDVSPARILAYQKTISETSDLYVTCSTFMFKKQSMVYVYLWRNGLLTDKRMQKEDQYDTTFIIQRVGLDHSGNYSCIFSAKDDLLSRVVKRGHNVIQILVISNFFPADISVVGPSTVSEGDDVAFRCTVSDTLETLGECELIHAYLRRNETILQVQAFNVTQMEVTFTIKSAIVKDSGHYSCVVLPSKCIQEHEKSLYGNNAVLLKVKASLVLLVIVSCGATILILTVLLGLCLWWINKQGHSASCDPCASSEQTNEDMVEEQQVQTEGEDLEAQYGDSFSEEEEDYQNAVAGEDFTYSDEAAYSFVDDPPAGLHSTSVYAKSFKQKKHRTQGSSNFNLT